MSCRCNGQAETGAQSGNVDLSTVSLMPRYAPAAGFGSLGELSTGTVVLATIGWLAVGGVCGAALWVAGKELLKS